MKRFSLIFFLLGWALQGNAQSGKLPNWVDHRPSTDDKCNYYYRVTRGEGESYDKAYAQAFARAILESSWKLGLDANTSDDVATLENNITQNVSVAPSRMVLPLNKVCEYSERVSTNRNIRIYILWQVAKYGNRQPNFEEFTNCE